jgi:Ca2+-binding EF-hand superfamily protein
MDIKLAPGQKLNENQRGAIIEGFNFATLDVETSRRKSKKEAKRLLKKPDIPRFLRACGRALTDQEFDDLLKKVPDKGVDENAICKIFERSCEKQNLIEHSLFEVLVSLDLTGTDTLDRKTLTELLCKHGNTMAEKDVDNILDGLPTNSLGRINCRAIARKLARGPEGVRHY